MSSPKSSVLSFEEFHTAQKRERATLEAETKVYGVERGMLQRGKGRGLVRERVDTVNKTNNSSDLDEVRADESEPPGKKWSRLSVGQLMELYEVQMILVALIYFDVIASTIAMLIQSAIENENAAVPQEMHNAYNDDDAVLSIIVMVLTSFTRFSLFLFVLELILLLFAFGTHFFSHIGYTIDLVIVTSCLIGETLGGSINYVRFLGFLRVWRIARLVSTTLNVASEAHENTKASLRKAIKQVNSLQSSATLLVESKKNETELRKEIEKMLQGYKDEVETLGEALKIAALDVAGAAQEEMMEQKKATATVYVDDEGDKFFDRSEERHIGSPKIVVHDDGHVDIASM